MAALAQKLILLLLCSMGLLLLPAGAQLTTKQELYVKPTEDTSCPEPCHTLDEYVQNASQYFVSSTTFNFLPGNHNLSQSLIISDVDNITLVSFSEAVITSNRSIKFTEISNLTLENLTFSSYLSFELSDLFNLNLKGCRMEKLTATNVFGSSSITKLILIPLPHEKSVFEVVYDDNHNQILSNYNYLIMSDWTLPQLHSAGQQVRVDMLLSQSNYSVDILMNRIVASPTIEVAISYRIESTIQNTVTMSNLNLMNANLDVTDNEPGSKTSLSISNCVLTYSTFLIKVTSAPVAINDTVFQTSPGTIVANADLEDIDTSLTLRNVTFISVEGNYTPNDFILDLRGTLVLHDITHAVLADCKFLNNQPNKELTKTEWSSLALLYSSDVTLENCEFRDNSERAITVASSTFTLLGENVFINNTASVGGAIAFYGDSCVTFTDGSTTDFMSNSAELVGGAIYVADTFTERCFFKLQSIQLECKSTEIPFRVNFIDNNSVNGGDSVYGASFDTCTVSGTECKGLSYVNTIFLFLQRFYFDFSAIASDPIRACLCVNRRPLCTKVFVDLTVYPGETFQIPAVVVGDRFGKVDGSVFAQLLPLSNTTEVAQLDKLQTSQHAGRNECTNLSYTVFSNSSAVTLALTALIIKINNYPNKDLIKMFEKERLLYTSTRQINATLRYFPIFINITLLTSCPLGFELSDASHQCVCDIQLQKHKIHCNFTTRTVKRTGTQWVNASFKNMTYSGVIVSKYCPNNYCKQEVVDVSLEHPDTQCAFNHSGILCGGCQSGLSATLGSAQCLSCSNAYLALLIPFALAGFVLVFFIKILNLTVAEGTLNGLIFYANVVRTFGILLAPENKTNVLTVFISWLNLDLGIKTCFFDGLDAYWKVWLQFVFPLYIWAIMFLIIVLSHYFKTAAKIFGRNSVQVLATLFLLSYTKIIRNIIYIFQVTTIEYPGGKSEMAWSYDGNILFFSIRHIPLVLLAVVVALFVVLPYTGVLTFTQCLQRICKYKRLNAVSMRLKPFLDAYFGPFKDKHRYWVGLLLLVRVILFTSFATLPSEHLGVNLLLTLAIVLGLLTYLSSVGQVYKNNYLSIIENISTCNLGMLTGGALYVSLSGGNQEALAYTSMGIAFLKFLVIVAAHVFMYLREYPMCLLRKLRQKPPSTDHDLTVDQTENVEVNKEPVTTVVNRSTGHQMVVDYSDYREPMLNDLDDHM